jgi:Dolichyl-phosphate-mannose-protein mannosyltransferase
VYYPGVPNLRPTAFRGALGERSLVLAIVLLVVLTRLPSLGQPLVEKHDWRQTQTAYAALIYSESGIDMLHPKVPVLGPPFDMPYEFPIYQAMASIPMSAGVPPDLALRLVCLATFIASAFFLWGLMRHVAGPKVALATLVFFSFSPLAIVWSRTSMIEYTATAGALAMLWAGIVWRERLAPLVWVAAFGGALVAMLVKPTTGVFYVLPLIAYRTSREDPRRLIDFIRARLDLRLIVMVGIPVALALLWTRYADGIKAANLLTAPYTSAGLSLWYFGTIAQRFDPEQWIAIAKRVGGGILGITFAPLLLCAINPALRSRQVLFWLGLAGAAVLPLVILLNPYVVQDYYFVAVSPAWAAFLGLGAAWLWDRVVDRRVLAGAAAVAVALSAVLMADYVVPIYQPLTDPFNVISTAEELTALSRPDDLVLVLGFEWAPSVHYYARRTGLAMPREFLPHPPGDPGDWRSEWSWPAWVDRAGAQAKATRDYPIMISGDPMIDPIWLGGKWPWMGVLGPRTYVLGNEAGELRGATLMATDDTTAAAGGRQLIESPITLGCLPGVVVDVPAGTEGTWIVESATTPPEARIRVTPELAPILAKHLIVASVEAAPPGTVLHLSCSGAESIVIDSVTDAPPPATG